MKHTRKYLAILLAISILLCSIIAITSFAANSSQGDNEAEIEELQPVMATNCNENIVYVNASWGVYDFTYPSSIIYYTSNGESSGTVLSVIYTNSFGGTTKRYDYANYNGTQVGHGNIVGPHVHYYSWTTQNGNHFVNGQSVELL